MPLGNAWNCYTQDLVMEAEEGYVVNSYASQLQAVVYSRLTTVLICDVIR